MLCSLQDAFSSHCLTCEVDTHGLQMSNLRFREAKSLSPDHTAQLVTGWARIGTQVPCLQVLGSFTPGPTHHAVSPEE